MKIKYNSKSFLICKFSFHSVLNMMENLALLLEWRRWISMSYLINKEIFKKKSDIITRAQKIISVTNIGDEINGENYDFILDLLKNMTNGNIKNFKWFPRITVE